MNTSIKITPYQPDDLADMLTVWNEVVSAGNAFPQESCLDLQTGAAFFAQQSYCGVARDPQQNLIGGLYILHPNNVGRCGHICNVSYAVRADRRGKRIGELLVRDCMAQAKKLGFFILQFNAVVADNIPARKLYERLGFVQLGTIPGGFRLPDGRYADICPYYRILDE